MKKQFILELAFITMLGILSQSHLLFAVSIPSSMLGATTYYIPVNIVNPVAVSSNTGWQVELNNLPTSAPNAMVGNVYIFNGISGSVMPSWSNATNVIWFNVGSNILTASGSWNGIYYIGIARPGTNLFSSTNEIGAWTCNSLSYDSGNLVFGVYDNFCGTTLKSQWNIGAGVATASVSNGLTYVVNTASNPGEGWTTAGLYTTGSVTIPAKLITYLSQPANSGCSGPSTQSSQDGTASGSLAILLSANQGGWGSGGPPSSIGSFTHSYSTGTYYYSSIYMGTTSTATFSLAGTTVASTGLTINNPHDAFIADEGCGSETSATIDALWTLISVPPPSNTLPLETYGSLTAAPSAAINLPTTISYGQTYTLTSSCSAGDTCQIWNTTANQQLCSGTTTCSWALPVNLAVGSYNFNAVDASGGLTSGTQTLTISQGTLSYSLNNCTNEQFTSIGYSCTTTGGFYYSYNNVLAEQQNTGTLKLNSVSVGTTTTSSNTVSSTISNTIIKACYTFTTPGNGNFLSGNAIPICWSGYTPLYIENATMTSGQGPAANTLTGMTYPIKFYTNSPSNTISFTFNSQFGTNTPITQQNSVSNVNFIPGSNSLTGNYAWTVNEIQGANSISILQNTNTLGMIVLNSASGCQPASYPGYTTSNALLVNFPIPLNGIVRSCWTVGSIPSSFKINGYSNSSTPNAVINDVAGSNTTTLITNLLVSYGGFSPAITFNLTSNTGLNSNTITLANGCPTGFFKASNTVPSAPCTREILNVSTRDQRTFGNLATNTTTVLGGLFNNHTLSNTTSYNANAFQLYIPLSTFQNPKISLTSITLTSTASSHFLGINNYCPTILNSTTFATYRPYLVDLNGSLYTFNIYSGYSNGGIGDYMQVLSGISASSAVLVQQYKINGNPFAQPLENGGSYAFRFLNGQCGLVYASNFSVWGNPISINIPFNSSVPTLQLPNVTAKCILSPTSYNSANIVCSGADTTSKVYQWVVTYYNITISGWTAAFSQIINSSTFSYTFNGVSNHSVSRVIAKAYAPGAQQSFTFDFNSNSVQSGFGVTARAFLMLLFLLVGLGISAVGESQGVVSAQHAVSSTLVIEAFMLALTWLVGLSTFIPFPAVVIMIMFLIVLAVMSHRYESGMFG